MRIGQTFFKNTDFIYYAIQRGVIRLDGVLRGSTLHMAHPPRLGRMLLSGEIDVAPASSIIYAQHPGEFLILPDFSISALGETGSILLFSEKCSSLEELDGGRIAVPGTSATSSALLQILLWDKRISVETEYHEKPEVKSMLRSADAALLIGDDALIANSGRNRVLCDLGEAWRAATGRNMVYALWLIRSEFAEAHPEQLRAFHEQLLQCRRYAYENIKHISGELASKLGISPELMRWHLSKLDYGFNRENEEGLREYFRRAEKFRIIKTVPELKFLRV